MSNDGPPEWKTCADCGCDGPLWRGPRGELVCAVCLHMEKHPDPKDDPRSINPTTQRPYHDVQSELPEGWEFVGGDVVLTAHATGKSYYARVGLPKHPVINGSGPAAATFQALRALLREARRRGWDVGDIEP